MKKIFIISLLLPALANGQELSCIGGSAQIQQVIPIEGKTAAEIYKLANRWIAKNFHNKDKVIQSTIENEMIRGDGYEPGIIKMGLLGMSGLGYTFNIDIKENKMRFTMNNMKVYNTQSTISVQEYCCKNDGSIRTNSQSQHVKEGAENWAKRLIESLKSMQNEKSDDW